MIKSNDGINITRGTIVMNGSTRMRFYEQESSNLERKRRKYDIRMSSEYFRKILRSGYAIGYYLHSDYIQSK
jgi:hypothetical protein